MLRAKVTDLLGAGFVPAYEHHVDTFDAGIGTGDIPAHEQIRAARRTLALALAVAGGHGPSVRRMWHRSQ